MATGPAPLGTHADIRYFAASPRGVLNPPEATGMPFWSFNPYVGCAFGCGYCYARFTHRYTAERLLAGPAITPEMRAAFSELPAALAFERRIFVKESAPALMQQTLARPSVRLDRLLRGETLVIGTATDPYQPAERRFRVTRGVLEALAERPGLRVVIITKSPLIARDVDVLARLSMHARLTINVSLITLDRTLARRLEPRAPTPESRLHAIERLASAGIDVGVNVMPVLPGITDRPADLAALVQRVAAAGATHLNAGALRLRAEARRHWRPLLAREFPELVARYDAAYGGPNGGATHVSERYRAGLAAFLAPRCARAGLGFNRRDLPGRGESLTTNALAIEPAIPSSDTLADPRPATPAPIAATQLDFSL
jgi:DNA repair photolyase